MLVLGLLPFVLLFVFAPFAFKIFLGPEWEQAGIITRILTGMFFFKFVFMGLSGVVIQVSERYEFEIIWQSSLLILGTASLYFGKYFYNDVYYSLGFYSITCTLLYIIAFIIAYKYSKDISKLTKKRMDSIINN